MLVMIVVIVMIILILKKRKEGFIFRKPKRVTFSDPLVTSKRMYDPNETVEKFAMSTGPGKYTNDNGTIHGPNMVSDQLMNTPNENLLKFVDTNGKVYDGGHIGAMSSMSALDKMYQDDLKRQSLLDQYNEGVGGNYLSNDILLKHGEYFNNNINNAAVNVFNRGAAPKIKLELAPGQTKGIMMGGSLEERPRENIMYSNLQGLVPVPGYDNENFAEPLKLIQQDNTLYQRTGGKRQVTEMQFPTGKMNYQ